jgi:hypothetical protein
MAPVMRRLTRRAALMGSMGFGSLAVMPRLHAQQAGTDPAVAAVDQTAYEATANLEDTIQHYIERMGFRTQPGLMFEFATASVPKPGSDPEWAKLRSIAFDQALLDAQAKIVQAENSTIQADAVSRLFRAGNEEPPPFQSSDLNQPGKIADIARKIVGLTGAKFDAALREEGIDPAELERAPEPQRHVQLANAIRSRSVTRAVGVLSGFVTVKSFESHDGNGNFLIGTVIVGSQRIKAVVQQIVTRRGEFQPDMERARDVHAIVADRQALVDDFGVRLVYDEAGLPVIVSFAQWGISYRGNDRNRMEMELGAAGQQVRATADRQIAEFLAASGQYERTTETGREIEAVAQRHADGYDERQPSIVTVTDAMLNLMRRRAKLNNFTGLTTLASWSQRHPVTRQQLIGCVRAWSAAAERDIRSSGEAARPATPQGPPGTRSSRDLMNSRDF